jgi:hypothetical protein
MDSRADLRFARRGERSELIAARAEFPLRIRGPLVGAGQHAEAVPASNGGDRLDDSLHITIYAEPGARTPRRRSVRGPCSGTVAVPFGWSSAWRLGMPRDARGPSKERPQAAPISARPSEVALTGH